MADGFSGVGNALKFSQGKAEYVRHSDDIYGFRIPTLLCGNGSVLYPEF